MKKTIIFGIIGLLLIGSILAITLSNKQEMLNYFNNYKQDRENTIEGVLSTITYVSDKECSIDYHTEKIECKLCFEYNLTIDKNKIDGYDCITTRDSSTNKQNDDEVRGVVRKIIDEQMPIEDVKYISEYRKGDKIKLK